MGNHDRVFKALLDEEGLVEALLRERLPKRLARRITGPPERVAATFIDAELRESLADQVLRVPLSGGEVGYVICVLEHKRKPEPYVAVQVLRYASGIYSRLPTPRAGGKLPLVIALVVYNGTRPWRVPRRFADLVDVQPELRRYAVDFEMVVLDLRRTTDGELSRHGALRGGLLALKAATVAPSRQVGRIQRMARRAAMAEPSTYDTFIKYAPFVVGEPAQSVLSAMVEAAPEKEANVISVADQLMNKGARRGRAEGLKRGLEKGLEKGRQEGREEGREEGRLDGLRTALTSLLKKRFKRLPAKLAEKLAAADLPTLERWLDAAIDAPTLAAVFDRQ